MPRRPGYGRSRETWSKSWRPHRCPAEKAAGVGRGAGPGTRARRDREADEARRPVPPQRGILKRVDSGTHEGDPSPQAVFPGTYSTWPRILTWGTEEPGLGDQNHAEIKGMVAMSPRLIIGREKYSGRFNSEQARPFRVATQRRFRLRIADKPADHLFVAGRKTKNVWTERPWGGIPASMSSAWGRPGAASEGKVGLVRDTSRTKLPGLRRCWGVSCMAFLSKGETRKGNDFRPDLFSRRQRWNLRRPAPESGLPLDKGED